MPPIVKRTYGSNRTRLQPSSPRSDLTSEPNRSSSPTKRKRDPEVSFMDLLVGISSPPAKKSKSSTKPTRQRPLKPSTNKQLKQLHLTLARSAVHTCATCQLSYTRGAPEDEELHKKHCARISRGSEWAREEAKSEGGDVAIVETSVPIGKGKERGRVVKFSCDIGGKVGSKFATLLQTINFTLSAPDLSPEVLACSKAYLFLLPTSNPSREKIVGCVIAQRIENAMKVVTDADDVTGKEGLIRVDDDERGKGALYCDPTPLPTPLGIPRMFVSSQHRHKGIAQVLLGAAARTFIHGCQLDPKEGQVAFSQPTTAGRGVMEKWGGGSVRIFQE